MHSPQNPVPRRAHDRPRPRLAHRRLGDDSPLREGRADRSLRLITWTRPTSSAIASPSSITAELATLDTPSRLKDSVPGTDVVEAEFEDAPANWLDVLPKLSQVTSVKEQDKSCGFRRITAPPPWQRSWPPRRNWREGPPRLRARHDARRRFLHYTGKICATRLPPARLRREPPVQP